MTSGPLVSSFVPYSETIKLVRTSLHEVFGAIYPWFEVNPEARTFKPRDGGWSITEILEHITLTTHFLLIVANNGCAKAVKRALSQTVEDAESDLERLLVIGKSGSFRWIRPEHMEPTGSTSESQVLSSMRLQQQRCLEILEELKNGEGSLFKVRMSVNELGRIDLYQWIYFIAQHAKRHIRQMEENLQEWRGGITGGWV